MLEVSPIPAFNDNYIWQISDQSRCVVVDPGDAIPVLNSLETTGHQLCAILCTHHHGDHTGGIEKLVNTFHIPVYGPTHEAKTKVSVPLKEGDRFTIPGLNLTLTVLDIPGHTLGHIAFYNEDYLFCGDTLFSAGCGRLFEGSPEQMYDSLHKLAALPDQTQVYCAHEYTQSNLAFAKTIEPNNERLLARIQTVAELRQQLEPTLPSTMEIEKATNPFLRCHEQEVIDNVCHLASISTTDPLTVFTALRQLKDNF